MTLPAHVLYLHGFASSVRTAKGIALGKRLHGQVRSYGIPDLEGADFRAMTMDTIFERARTALAALPQDGHPVLVLGSSLGGYVAAHLAASRLPRPISALVLIAPAFGFTTTWKERLGEAGIAQWRSAGERQFFHHASEAERPLGYGFLESCLGLAEMPGETGVPTAIVHGRQDETVPCQRSITYALERRGVELHVVEGDHRLGEARHEDLLMWCVGDVLRAACAAAVARRG
jgi:pimeloyl-ACP methyl ester carboxylesterase